MSGKVGWGILSVSNHYALRVHGQLEGSDLTTVEAIGSRDSGKAAREAARLGIPKAFGSYEALLGDTSVAAVYIPLPNNLHAEWIRKAADAGKHILCEKPFAMNAPEAAAAIAYAKAKGVKVMEAFMYRFHPQWQTARRIVRSGELGAPRFVHAQFSYMNKDAANIRNKPETGGGGIMDIGCYAVSSARFLLGAEPSRVATTLVRDPQFGTDSLATGILDFGSVQAAFTVSTQAFPAQRVDIVGTSGRLSVRLPFNMYPDVPGDIDVTTGIGTRTIPCGPAGQYRIMFDACSRAILSGEDFPIPAEDAIANMAVLDALFRAADSGKWEEPAR